MFNFRLKSKIAQLNSELEVFKKRINFLETENSRIHAILSSMVEGVVALDKDTRILWLNPTAENIFKTSKESSQGKNFIEVFPNNEIGDIIAICLKGKEPLSRELSLVWPVKKVFQVNASPIFESKIISGCLLVVHDITEIRRLETVRQDFVANVSHELKTPLTSIKGFVETLLEGAINDKENSISFLKIINAHAERLNSLIEDLLELSQIESNTAVLKKENLDFSELVNRVVTDFSSQAKKKNVRISSSLPHGLQITGDKSKLEQVMANLVNNAVKYNRENGFVKIYSEDLGNKIKLFIEDNGCGIPLSDIPRIFERFYRVDKARSREMGGTGLGLSIVKHIVELHKGSVGLESTEGLGSKFWFELPK